MSQPTTQQVISAIVAVLQAMSANPAAVTSALQDVPAVAGLNILRDGQHVSQPATPASEDSFDVVMDSDQPTARTPSHIASDGRTSVFVRNPPRDIGNITGFVCANCSVYNLVRDAKETWYCITTGRQVGVYKGYHTVKDWVVGFSGSAITKASSRQAALEDWAKACEARTIKWPGVDNANPDTFEPAGIAAHAAGLLGDASFPPVIDA